MQLGRIVAISTRKRAKSERGNRILLDDNFGKLLENQNIIVFCYFYYTCHLLVVTCQCLNAILLLYCYVK